MPPPPHLLLSHRLRLLPGAALEGTWADPAVAAEAQGLGRERLWYSFFSPLIPQAVMSAHQGPGSVPGDPSPGNQRHLPWEVTHDLGSEARIGVT